MAMMGRVLMLLVATLLASSLPAEACTPIVSVGFLGLVSGYALWLLLSLVLAAFHPFAWEELRYWFWWVPAGLFMFGLPFLLVLGFPAVVMMVAFPMHLAVQFVQALFDKPSPASQRGLRAFYYGAPLLVVVGVGILAKIDLYSQNGGLRAFWYNYSGPGSGFMAVWLMIGIVVLVLSDFRRRAAEQASE